MDTNYQYFDCLCRTCMNELVEATSYDGNTKPQQQWQSIFDRIEECGAFRIAELLTNAVPQIEVHSRDELPKRLCCKCLQELLIVYRFQQMCLQSQEHMRLQVSKKRSDLKIPMIGAAMEGEIETNNAGPYPLKTLQSNTTHQNLEHSSIQESLLETTEQMIKPEAGETRDDDIDQLLEDCRDAEGNLSEFVKNEPIEDDEPSIEYSDGESTTSAISEKGEQLSIEFEEQQLNETDSKAYQIMHGEDKPNECAYCPRRFRTKQHMFQHKEIHEGFKGEACDICGKIINKRFLKQHKLGHSNEKPHKCDFCEKRFVQMSNLKCHIVKHTGEKPFKCKYCERSFSQSSQRMKHMRAHLGDNVHRCELCPLAFPAMSELRIHFTTHKNEDPETRERNMKALKEAEAKLQQQFVKKAKNFDKISNLRVHIRKHTGEKPYKCKYCERSFSYSNHRITHMRIHLGDNVHRCELCPLGFPVASELRIHLTTHKNEDPETRERNMKALKEAEAKLQQQFVKKAKE